MPKATVKPRRLGKSFHLPRRTWSYMQQQQQESHPDISIPSYSYEVVTDRQSYDVSRTDHRCRPSGFRRVTLRIEYYVTVTVSLTITEDPERECFYRFDSIATTSPTCARIVGHQEGDCLPEPD